MNNLLFIVVFIVKTMWFIQPWWSYCDSTINREMFVYENIHVLNIRVNKLSRVPHENILTRKIVNLKLLCTYRRLSDY